MPGYRLNSMFKTTLAASIAALTMLSAMPAAQAESPFHTGVWQLNDPAGKRGLVVSDWLVWEDGLPKRWLYRRAGTNDANQFDFFTRSIGDSGFTPAIAWWRMPRFSSCIDTVAVPTARSCSWVSFIVGLLACARRMPRPASGHNHDGGGERGGETGGETQESG